MLTSTNNVARHYRSFINTGGATLMRPEWQHRQCGGLWSRILVPLTVASLVICGPYLHRASGAQGVLPCEGWGVTASQMDLPSLTPFSVAGCDRLQLEAAHWATSVALLQVVYN